MRITNVAPQRDHGESHGSSTTHYYRVYRWMSTPSSWTCRVVMDLMSSVPVIGAAMGSQTTYLPLLVRFRSSRPSFAPARKTSTAPQVGSRGGGGRLGWRSARRGGGAFGGQCGRCLAVVVSRCGAGPPADGVSHRSSYGVVVPFSQDQSVVRPQELRSVTVR